MRVEERSASSYITVLMFTIVAYVLFLQCCLSLFFVYSVPDDGLLYNPKLVERK